MRKILLVLLLYLTMSVLASAGSGDVRFSAFAGHNATYGVSGGVELSGAYEFSQPWKVRGAVRCSSYPKYTVDLRPSYIYDLDFGRLNVEAIAHYSHQSSTNDLCAGMSVGLHTERIWAALGYYYRTFSAGGSKVTEPVNGLYEVGFSCLPEVDRWNLYLIVSNSRMARLERAYQPTYILEGEYSPTDNLDIVMSIDSMRAGIFNIASVRYQNFLSIGVKYRW